ncbi:protein of unknown function (plasmid) [Pararobbsia alpina]
MHGVPDGGVEVMMSLLETHDFGGDASSCRTFSNCSWSVSIRDTHVSDVRQLARTDWQTRARIGVLVTSPCSKPTDA